MHDGAGVGCVEGPSGPARVAGSLYGKSPCPLIPAKPPHREQWVRSTPMVWSSGASPRSSRLRLRGSTRPTTRPMSMMGYNVVIVPMPTRLCHGRKRDQKSYHHHIRL